MQRRGTDYREGSMVVVEHRAARGAPSPVESNQRSQQLLSTSSVLVLDLGKLHEKNLIENKVDLLPCGHITELPPNESLSIGDQQGQSHPSTATNCLCDCEHLSSPFGPWSPYLQIGTSYSFYARLSGILLA